MAVDYNAVLNKVGPEAGVATGTGDPNVTLLPLIGTILNVALGLLGVILLVLTIYSGFLWMTAQGNEETVTKAKTLLRNAIIGLIITLAAYSIASYVSNIVGEATTASTSSAIE